MPRPRELLDVSSAGVARIRTAIEAARIKAQLAREESTRRRAAQVSTHIPIVDPNKRQHKKEKKRHSRLEQEEEGDEDEARLAASAAALERKAALYDELAARGGRGGAGAGEECSGGSGSGRRPLGRRGLGVAARRLWPRRRRQEREASA